MRQFYKFIILLLVFISPVCRVSAQGVKSAHSETFIKFTENKNQWDKKVLYRAQLDGGVLFFQKNCFTYNFYDKETLRANHVRSGKGSTKYSEVHSHAIRMTFVNSSESVTTSTSQLTPDYCNYFIGNDKSKWAGNVRNYREINYQQLYSGIDMQVEGLENSVKYNFIVSPQADPNDIQLSYEGADFLSIEKGALQIKTSVNLIQEQRPFAYQWIGSTKKNVNCEFVLENNIVHFTFPDGYNKSAELIIDPVLVFACSSGSTADNFGMTATYDAGGNLYSGGTCFDIGFPTTVGAYDVSYNGIVAQGRTDVVITKYDSSGTFLQYSTYLGGAASTEIVTSLVVDGQDNLFAYGATGSSDFPVTSNAYDQTFNGGTGLTFAANGTTYLNGTDIYIAKLNPAGSALLACTFIGGSQNDGVNVDLDSLQYNYGDQYRGEINVDPTGNVYVVSSTRSADFPIVNGFDNSLGGLQDAVVFKMDANLTQLMWSTYLGGSNMDAGYALALDDSLNVYVTGGTRSTTFPFTPGALHTSFGGGKADGYITRIKKDGTAILASTFIGTSSYDQCYFVQLDKHGNVYVVGQTEGAMPVTGGVYSNANSGQFISKLNDGLTNQVFSTVFGNGNGMPNISPAAFLVDYCENIYVSGWGGNILTGVVTTGMPLTGNAIQPTTDGFNFYLFVLSTNASSLIYATYFGGAQSREHVDGGTSRFDKKSIVYQSVCAGCGGNDDFPVTPGSWPNTGANVNHAGNCNNGTFKFDFQVPLASANFTVDFLSGCSPLTVQFNNLSTIGNGNYLWNFGSNDTTSTVLNPIRTFNAPGTYLVQLYVHDPASCNLGDTAFHYVTVYPSMTADFNFISSPCSNQVAFLDSSYTAPSSWLWNFDDGTTSTLQNPNHIYGATGTYNVQLIATNSNGCTDTTVVQLDFASSATSVNPSTSICFGNNTQLLASGGYSYSWSPSSGLSNPSIANPFASPSVTTTYTVTIHSIPFPGDTCVVSLTTTVFVYSPSAFPLLATADRDTISIGSGTILHANTDTTLTILWTPSSGISNPYSFNPTVAPIVTTTYTVTITDSSGCPKSSTITIYVISMKCTLDDAFVPNTFTPNGDGQNDVLFVRSISLSEMYFAVYNRWGELVFESNDLKKGWDGIYKGKPSDPDVFAWYLTAKCYSGEEMKKKGNVTLIR